MEDANQMVLLENIQRMIFTFRGVQVMIDKDLAQIYQVENKRLNEQVRRNITRFPEEFRFQLNDAEKAQLVANCDRFKSLKHSTVNPFAFSKLETGALEMLKKLDEVIRKNLERLGYGK